LSAVVDAFIACLWRTSAATTNTSKIVRDAKAVYSGAHGSILALSGIGGFAHPLSDDANHLRSGVVAHKSHSVDAPLGK
jgi:hypothetical protein